MAHDKPETAKARVERWRTKRRAVTLATIGGELSLKLAQCVKCPECAQLTREAGTAVVCPPCQQVRDEGLAKCDLTENRASTTHAGKISTGDKSTEHVALMRATRDRNEHGHSSTYEWHGGSDKDSRTDWKPQKVGRYTGPIGTNCKVYKEMEAAVQKREQDPNVAADLVWRNAVLKTAAFAEVSKRFPNLSFRQRLKVFALSPVGKATWLAIKSGAAPLNRTVRNESLGELLQKQKGA